MFTVAARLAPKEIPKPRLQFNAGCPSQAGTCSKTRLAWVPGEGHGPAHRHAVDASVTDRAAHATRPARTIEGATGRDPKPTQEPPRKSCQMDLVPA
jgi:hypothetical protein